MMDIGTKAKSLFLPSPLELGEKEDGFQKDFKLYEINNRRSLIDTAIKHFLSKLLLHSIAEKEL